MTNFESDLRALILKLLPYDKSDPKLNAELLAMPVTTLLIWFYNWQSRLIYPIPRTVFRSKDLIFRKMPLQHQVDVEILLEKIERGEDVNSHLSERVRHGYRPSSGSKRLNRRLDLDLLLNDWGIHHLHISSAPGNDSFSQRGSELLFVMMRGATTYALDVMGHDFGGQHLAEVAIRNWPGELFRPLGVAVSTTPRSAAEVLELRAAGIVGFIQYGGTAYAPVSGGISTAGTASGRRPGPLLHQLAKIEAELTKDPHFLDEFVAACGVACPPKPSYKIDICQGVFQVEFGILEENTGVMIGVPQR